MEVSADPILARFHDALARAYGERLERAVLFGSRARGDGREDSDYDVAIFIRDCDSFEQESRRLAEIETVILYDTGQIVCAVPFAAAAYAERTAFMREVRRDGIDL